MTTVNDIDIVEHFLHSHEPHYTTEDSIVLSSTQAAALRDAFVEQQRKNYEYEALLAKNKERISSYEKLIVDLKCEMEKMKGKEDEYKLQIRQVTDERNDWKREPEKECSQPSQSERSSESLPTKDEIEEIHKPKSKRRGSSEPNFKHILGNLFPSKDSVVGESLRSVRSMITKRCQSANLRMTDECTAGSSTLTDPQQNSTWQVMTSEGESKESFLLKKECDADDPMLSKPELNATHKVTENQTKLGDSSFLENERVMDNLMWKHALDLDRSETLLREELMLVPDKRCSFLESRKFM